MGAGACCADGRKWGGAGQRTSSIGISARLRVTATVNGGGSRWSTTGAFTVGSTGSGNLNIANQGDRPCGTRHSTIGRRSVNLYGGGTLRFNTISGLNRLNYDSGTIQLAGNRNLGTDATIAYLFGPLLAPPASITIPSGKSLHVEGAAELDRPTKTVTVSGGSLTSADLVLGGYLGGQGTLVITNGGAVTTTAGSYLGGDYNTSGVITVSGASTWSVGSTVSVGLGNGYGALGIQDQSLVTIGANLVVGSPTPGNFGSGFVNIQGQSRISVGADLLVESDHAGSVNIQDQSLVTVGANLVISGNDSSGAVNTVTVNGSSLISSTLFLGGFLGDKRHARNYQRRDRDHHRRRIAGW